GGFISASLGGRIKSEIERGALISPKMRIFLAVFGGALVGFATRFTRGCTSHQAISGGALLSVGSWVFMLSVFAGGFAAAFVLRRIWR
ncbi:MAG: YeeE/YedE family protein, partial [Proteobacteria bacterium]|nr:YeeE/YedE family protein [Pseudomonadota bacterium]